MKDFVLLAVLMPEDADMLAGLLAGACIDVRTDIREHGKDCSLTAISVSESEIGRAAAVMHDLLRKCRRQSYSSYNDRRHGIMIPVDLTEKSYVACNVGLELAERLATDARILHAYHTPYKENKFVESIINDSLQKSSKVNRGMVDAELNVFAQKLRELQRKGKLPEVNFDTLLLKGVPEDCIREQARVSPPEMIVMSTRSHHKKTEELVGSVTAEVLDSCRVPVFTVPEDYTCPGIRNITRLLFFCNCDKNDVMSMRRFMSIFDNPSVNVTLVPAGFKSDAKLGHHMDDLCREMAREFENVSFDTLVLSSVSFRDEFKSYVEKNDIQLLIVQNKKKNIISRLINPGIAHMLLYERDMPMVIVPV